MKNRFALLFFSAIVTGTICLSGCKKVSPPTPCYGNIPSTVTVGVVDTFTSCTTGANSYLWVFGDGKTASTANTTHAYTVPGTYHGSFTVSNGEGSTKNFTITVLSPVNIWTFKGISDTSATALISGNSLESTNFSSTNMTNVSNVTFTFAGIPTVSGTYNIISESSTPSASQVSIYLNTAAGATYGSTGSAGSTAAVTVYGGKITITIPSAMLSNASNPADSAVFTAKVGQSE